jgi:hypothetical protein
MIEWQTDIAGLRKAAEERDPEQIQFLLKRLYLTIGFYMGLAVAVERAYAFVATFECYHPEAFWARQVLVQITSTGTAPGKLPEEAMGEFTSPGAGNFVKALSDLAHAAQQNTQLEARIGYLVSATVNAVMADVVESWYGERLDDWERVRQNTIDPETGQYVDPEATQIPYQFWTDETVAQRDTRAWLTVAEAIETHHKREGWG